MIRLTLFMCTMSMALVLPAQKQNHQEVINAEKSFAAYSVEHGTKEAFLQYLDSTGVVFDAGQPINGIAAWNKKQTRPGVLNWHPIYGFVSRSGELGFTTGPWTFQPKTIQDSVVARGQYSTVWKKNKAGEWKFIVDMGISKTPAFDDAVYQFPEQTTSFIPGTWNNLLNKEQKFIQQTKEASSDERRKAYENVASKMAFFLNRSNQLPVIKTEDISAAMNMPAKIEYKIEGSAISDAGDMGYVYGSTTINEKKGSYLRIWRREGKEWRLALEVLEY